jgi:hypothetical protein
MLTDLQGVLGVAKVEWVVTPFVVLPIQRDAVSCGLRILDAVDKALGLVPIEVCLPAR